MRRLTLLSVLALGLAACGGSAAQRNLKITLGRSGGTMVPWSVTIAPDGSLTTQGSPPAKPKSLTSAKDAELSRLVRSDFAKLKSEQCAGTFPDESGMFITALGKTVSVRGDCENGFNNVWNELAFTLGESGGHISTN